ncbi:hypothetical protein LTS14_008027 [Recurvomyces mirabilis]|uniref:uncharacterized protein n=1 Tax=Recurvomyces mirabilis TaxID=574656 RepID=UPI002DE1222B|nr:hypothetical protein LTS14_008027 [Recurvomyces mirabilis]
MWSGFNLQKAQEQAKQQAGWSMTITKNLTAIQETDLKSKGVTAPDMPFIPALRIIKVATQTAEDPSDRGKIGNDRFSWVNESHEPHLTEISRYGEGLIPYPNTNYTWRGTVEQLHTHVTRLRAKRQKLAREAELLWQWLAKREADMYSIPMQPMGEGDERLAARRYIEVLGNTHQKVWNRISQCDWMIADAQKRVTQLQASDGLANDNDAPPTSTAPKAENVRAELSLPLLRDQPKYNEQWQQQCQAEKEAFEKLQKGMAKKTEQMTGFWQALVSPKEQDNDMVRGLVAKTLKQKEKTLDAAMFDVAIMRKIIQDAE